MREFKLLKWYPTLPTEWYNSEFPIIVVERETSFALHPSLKGKTRFAEITEREVDRNGEFWEELIPSKVILTTEDGVNLYVGDLNYVPQRRDCGRFTGTVLETKIKESSYSDPSLRFAKKENAEDYIKKYKYYTTVDGYAIRKGDKFYIYDDKFQKIQYGEFGHFTAEKYNGKRYRTKEEVESLVELNKKQYSLKDIHKLLNRVSWKLHSREDVLNALEGKDNLRLEL